MDDRDARLAQALKSLDGLSVGDAFGEFFFRRSPYETKIEELPARWEWTDDTHMACPLLRS